MRRKPLLALSVSVLWMGLAFATADAAGAIYGTVTTTDGDVLTGPIRWDKNENFWDDVLNARKVRTVDVVSGRQQVRIFGLNISKSGGTRKIHSELAVPFGHIRSIHPMRRGRVEITFKDNRTVEVRGTSDIGDDMRGIVVDDAVHGAIDIDWEDVDRVEFDSTPAGTVRDTERLYGTLTTRRAKFTGFIVWDRDESLSGDILDGDEDGRSYKVPFRRIEKIQKRDKRSSVLLLTTGRRVVLSGSNDVDDDNRGIMVTIPGVGSVEADWREFREVEFFEAPESRAYEAFDGGERLFGTVTTTDGREFEGTIVWDNDEEYTWEPLDGEVAGVEFSILFENIATIRRYSKRSAEVELKTGEVYRLEDSNDVGAANKGIVIRLSDGDEVALGWDDFEAVSFGGR